MEYLLPKKVVFHYSLGNIKYSLVSYLANYFFMFKNKIYLAVYFT